jgi:hypothetical protein
MYVMYVKNLLIEPHIIIFNLTLFTASVKMNLTQ